MSDLKNNQFTSESELNQPPEPPEKENRPSESSLLKTSKGQLRRQNNTLEHSGGSHSENKTYRSKNVSEVRTFYSDKNATDSTAQRTVNPNTSQSEKRKEGYSSSHSHPLYQMYVGIVSIFFIILGITALGVLGWESTQTSTQPTQEKASPPSIIYTEEARSVPQAANSQTTIDRIHAAKNKTSLLQGSILNIYVTKNEETNLISTQEFLRILAPATPLPLTRYLEEDFLYGSYTGEENEIPFIIIQVADYENAYATMLDMEPQLQSIFSPLFNKTSGGLRADNGSGSEPEARESETFNDQIIRNQDVRVLSQNGSTELLYSFPNRNSLVITTKQEALIEVFDRLNRTN